MQQKQYDAVLQDGPAVLAMYPEYVEDANVYELMADADRERRRCQIRNGNPRRVCACRRTNAGRAQASG